MLKISKRDDKIEAIWEWPKSDDIDSARLIYSVIQLGTLKTSQFTTEWVIDSKREPRMIIPIADFSKISTFRIAFLDSVGTELFSDNSEEPTYYYGETLTIYYRYTCLASIFGENAYSLRINAPERISKQRLWLSDGENRFYLPKDIEGNDIFVLPCMFRALRLHGDEFVKKKYRIEDSTDNE